MSELTKRIETLISPTVEHMGYDIVRVALLGTARKQTLQVMAERKDAAPISVDDCEAISRSLSALLDVEDPISANYNLEVSSPGIDRPLTRLADYERFKGHLATLDLQMPTAEGRKRFQGELVGLDGETVIVANADATDAPFRLPFDNIAKAKLVLTDKLINAKISN